MNVDQMNNWLEAFYFILIYFGPLPALVLLIAAAQKLIANRKEQG